MPISISITFAFYICVSREYNKKKENDEPLCVRPFVCSISLIEFILCHFDDELSKINLHHLLVSRGVNFMCGFPI